MVGAGILYLCQIGHRLVPGRRKPVNMESEHQEGKYSPKWYFKALRSLAAFEARAA